MRVQDDGWVRLKPEVCPGDDIDRTRPVRADKRTLYPLLIRAPEGMAEHLVFDINPKAMTASPMADTSSLGFGVAVLMILVCVGLNIFFAYLGWVFVWNRPLGEKADLFIVSFLLVMGGAASAGAVYFCRLVRNHEYTHPTLINRRTGKVIQMQGRKRVEAHWQDLQPYAEHYIAINLSGGTTAYHFHLLQPSEGGSRALQRIAVKFGAPGTKGAARYYRFLCDYMDGRWENLPDIHQLSGIRPSFWQQFRLDSMVGPWFNQYDWSKRSAQSKRRMWTWVPLVTALFWPFHMLCFVGARLGWVPEFSEKDLADAAWSEAVDGPMPETLARKISTPEPHREEKWLYGVSLLLGAALWGWATLWFIRGIFFSPS